MGCGCGGKLGVLLQKKLPPTLTYGEILGDYLTDMKEGNIYKESDLVGEGARACVMLKHLACMDFPAVTEAFKAKNIKVENQNDIKVLCELAEDKKDVEKLGFSLKEFLPTIQVATTNMATCNAKYVD